MEGKEWIWDNGTLVEVRISKNERENKHKSSEKQASEDVPELATFLKML